jgi:hypothetical protein
MPIPDVDAEILISRLAGGLAPPDRTAFRRAAESALVQLPYAGEGLVYRTVAALWRTYFHPPEDTSWDIAQELPRNSKLNDGPPIGADGRADAGRERRLRVVAG